MAYADGLLSKGERITHREKQHWWVFVWGARFTILAIIVAIVFFFLGGNLSPDGSSGTFRSILSWITAALFVGGLALLLWTTLRYLNQEYVLTNRRVLQVEGVFNKRVVDSSLEKINDAVLEQSIFGRALGFGDLKILTASEAAISEFKMIRNPIQFKKAMLDAKYEYERDVAGTGDVVSPPMRQPAAATPVAGGGDLPPPAASAAAAGGVAGAAAAAPVGDETRSAATPGGPSPAPLSADDVTRTLGSLADLRDRGAISAEEYERKKADLLGRL
jgi:hypothetical protein